MKHTSGDPLLHCARDLSGQPLMNHTSGEPLSRRMHHFSGEPLFFFLYSARLNTTMSSPV